MSGYELTGSGLKPSLLAEIADGAKVGIGADGLERMGRSHAVVLEGVLEQAI